jgi:hypothetical protein
MKIRGDRGVGGMLARAWVIVPISFFIMCAGWALTSPVGSAPDDDYHLSSIWCAQGLGDGVCEAAPGNAAALLVPANVARAGLCFRFEASINAGCTLAAPGAGAVSALGAVVAPGVAPMVALTHVNNVEGLYPTAFYTVMSVFVGPDVERSVLNMRLFNILIASLLLAGLLRLTPHGLGSASVLAITVTFIPLGLFITASTNPSSWSVVGIGAYWAFAIAFLRHRNWRDRRGILLAAATAVSAAMAIGSRVDASTYVVLATVIALTVSGWRRALKTPGRLVLLGVIVVAAGITYLTVSPVSVIATDGASLGTANAGVGLLLTNLAYLPVLFQGIVGGWNLGWNDTLMPPYIPVIGTVVVGALLYRGLAAPSRRKLVTAGIAALALVAVPIVFLQTQRLGVGELVQPRYLLPLLTLLVGVVSLGPTLKHRLELPKVPALLIVAALSVSAILAFWANAHRYFAGSGFGLFDPKVDPAWVTSSGVPLAVTVVITVLATIIFIAGSVGLLPTTSLGGTRRAGRASVSDRLT